MELLWTLVCLFCFVLNRCAERELRESAQGLAVHSGPESFFKVNREQRGVNTTADRGIGEKSSSDFTLRF